jgi:branched-chain amino acid transport system ATP-binding protein
MLEVDACRRPTAPPPRLWGVSLRVEPGELVCVVGPNGAGKSTLINVIAGLHRARAGRLVLDGQDITQLASHRFCAAGIAIVPEGRRLFTGMSVQDNLELGSYLPGSEGASARSLEQVLALFPALQAEAASRPGRCRAASSRWWPSAAR